MRYDFLMEMRAYHPARTDNYSPCPCVDKYCIAVNFMPGLSRPEPNAELDGRMPRDFSGFITFGLSVDIPDDLGIEIVSRKWMLRKGHRTSDGSGSYCLIVAPQLVWDIPRHKTTDDILADAEAHIKTLKTVNLSYPDGHVRKTIPLAITNWWVIGANFPVDASHMFAARNPGEPVIEFP